MKDNSSFLREFQKKVELAKIDHEITVIQYWRGRLDKLIAMKPEGIGALQSEMTRLSGMMENRIKTLKKELG
jgi:50S ribosomal subunit-associated GTPase HflX